MKEESQVKNLRTPIVVVLGHVDHGKTTLLDRLRKTNVAAKEAGGITQGIGASEVVTKEGKKITFIDTPGHAAFANMRSRGAKVADIAILVIAADDGIKPQTKEALGFILAASVPLVIAATKVDLPTASIPNLKTQLAKEGVALEGQGGEVPLVAVSGKTGEGIENLLEMITLMAELHDIKADPNAPLEAVVIETAKDNRGPTASVVVHNGVLKLGDQIISGTVKAKIRGLFDYSKKSVEKILPGEPGQILGFSELPPIGSTVQTVGKETEITKLEKNEPVLVQPMSEDLQIVFRASNSGELEAILANLPRNVGVVTKGVGDVTESDVFSAKAAGIAGSGNTFIFSFNSKVPQNVSKLAETEGVKIEKFDIIYKLFERVDEIIKKGEVIVLGKAEIRATFPYEDRKVAGCKVIQGKIGKADDLVLQREEKNIGSVKVSSMKKGRADITEAKQGEEFGLIFSGKLDFKIGDVLISVAR